MKDNVAFSNDQNKILNKKEEIDGNLEKLIKRIHENEMISEKPLDKDIKRSVENTIIDVFSHNQKLEELIEEMKSGFQLKNKQIG